MFFILLTLTIISLVTSVILFMQSSYFLAVILLIFALMLTYLTYSRYRSRKKKRNQNNQNNKSSSGFDCLDCADCADVPWNKLDCDGLDCDCSPDCS